LVEGAPALDFVADNQTSCTAPLTVNFTSTAPRAVTWLWDFGDGNTSTLANPQHTYAALGRYDVSLTITDANGCTNTLQKDDFILVEEPQAAFAHNLNDFTVFPDLWDGRDPSVIRGGCLPLPIDFTDQSYSPTPIISWDWNFGDGNTLTGTDANPQHTYTTEGEFTVSLSITTLDGCVSTVTCDSCIRAGNRPTAMLDTSAYPLLQCCSAQTLFQNATDPNTHDYVWYSVTTGDWDGFLVNDTSNGNWDFGSTVPVFRDSGQYVSTMFYTYNKGCVDSFYLDKWTMLRPPYASGGIDFFPCETNWPPGGTVTFDTSNTLYLLDTAYIDSVEWTFPGGVTSNEFYPSFTFPDTGAYWIGVTVWNFDNGCRCRTSGEQILQIIAQPDTTFMLMPPAGCSPLEVSFTGPTTNVSSWQWDLGGGITSTDPNPVFNLDSLGSYDVSLIVANANGCKDTVFRPDAIQVNGIVPRIDLSQDIGCLPLNLTLTDQSSHTAPIVSRVWELGDGTLISGNDSVLTHLYDSMLVEPRFQLDGIPIVLTVTDSTGCSASDTAYLRLIQPIASYLTDTISICQGDSLFLTGLGGDSLAVSRLLYDWEFVGANPNTANGGEVVSFFGAGTDLSVRLTVTDTLGCTASRIDTFDVVPVLPTADFEAFPTGAVCPPLVVNFTDLSQPGNAPITEWLWDFGDGTQSRLQNPIKIFSDFDTYDISLTVTDSLGCSNSFFIPDLVQLTGVQGGFTMNTNVICAFDSILFTANSPNAGSYTWDFGDGTIGVGRVVTHPYNEAGLNIPTLILEDSTGTCSVSISDTLIVNPIPPLNMPGDTAFCDGGEAVFDVFEAGAEYQWNTGASTPTISATQSGIYRVVISYPGTGCSNTDEVELIVHPNPSVNIGGPVELCEGDTLLLYAETPNTLNVINWNFTNLGSGGPDSLRIALAQSEEVRIEVRDQNNCPAADSLFVEVIPYPEIDLSYDPLCLGDTLLLDATPPNIQDPTATFFWWKDQEPLGNLGPVISVTEEGSYELAYYLRGCLSEFGAEVFFNPLPESDIYEEQLNCVYKGQYVTLDAGEAFDYNWLHTGESSRFVEVVAADTYYVEVFNEFRCSVLDSTAVIDACPPLLYVPTAFSPNGDGVNEEFAWGGDYLADFQMQIYSRWGMLLYETRDPAAFWDGRFKGQQVQEGVYTWIVRYNGTHPDYQKIFQRAGTVTVFR
ncbi:MAG: PKD domain-containing protein, partial [Bacteroidota bacterium]